MSKFPLTLSMLTPFIPLMEHTPETGIGDAQAWQLCNWQLESVGVKNSEMGFEAVY